MRVINLIPSRYRSVRGSAQRFALHIYLGYGLHIPLGECSLMLLSAGYFDESYDRDECYTVAGLVAINLQAALGLEWEWERLLALYGIDYFKASELEHGRGEFLKLRDDPANGDARFSKREKDLFVEIKTAFVDAIVNADCIVGIGATLLLADYERLGRIYPHAMATLPHPYFICQQFVMLAASEIMNWANSRNPPERKGMLRPIFDIHEEYGGRAKLAFDEYKRKNPLTSKCLLPMHYEDDQTYLMLQAADLLAYETRRLLVDREYHKDRDERTAMVRLRARIYKVFKLDYDGLKRIADHQVADDHGIRPAISNSERLVL